MSKKLSNKDLKWVERYFDLELSETEMDEFHERMEQDSEFKEEVQNYHQANTFVETLDQGHRFTPKFPGSNQNRFKRMIIYSILIGMLCLALYSFFSFTYIENEDEADIYAEIELYTNDLTTEITRGQEHHAETQNPYDIFQPVFTHYKNKNLEAAKRAIHKIDIDHSENDNITELNQWLLIKTFLLEKDFKKIIYLLQKIKAHPNYNSSHKAKIFIEQIKQRN